MALVGLLALLIFFFWLGGKYQSWSQEDSRLLVSQDKKDEDRLRFVQEPLVVQESIPTTSEAILVHVTGAVERPGVYELSSEDRVQDALDLAGLSADADPDQMNLAQAIHDGEKIVVPRQGEVIAPGAASESSLGLAQTGEGKVSINHADLNALMTLPSVGEVRAQAIIDYRESHGGFQSLEDLKQVSGIGDKTYAQIEPHISL